MVNPAQRIFASAIVILLVSVLALALPAIAMAGNVPAQRVGRVLFTIDIQQNNPTSGPFTSSGKAADKGIVCPSGTILDTAKTITPWKNGRGIDVEGVRVFTCADGPPGTFTMSFLAHVRLEPSYRVWGKWHIDDGTGGYMNLFGRGRLTTVLDSSGTLEGIDYFKGTIGSRD